MSEENLISIDGPKSDFSHFLSIDNNKRIFFSGKFGIGKTFFLDKYFYEHGEEYDVYHLFPVRYQITSNENIIELIKYDILVELIKKYPSAFQSRDVCGVTGWFALFSSFFKEKASVNNFLTSFLDKGEYALSLSPDPFLQLLSKLGRPLKDLLDIDKKFQEFKKEYIEGERKLVDDFFSKIEFSIDKKTTDYVSYLLKTKIAELKSNKKSILILDDFDRIDPEHIFRILNILSAHIDGEEENKFGFDNIIIVGDIKNLKNIFHHKYGDNTEFWGYFDKFFTVKPYIFNNEKAIAERIPYMLQKIKYEELQLSNAIAEGGIIKGLLSEVLGRAFAINSMNLRQLYKPITHSFSEMRNGVFTNNHFSDQRNQCIDIAIKLLVALYGDSEYLIEVIKKIRDKSSDKDVKQNWFFKEYGSSMIRRMTTHKPGTKFYWLDKYLLVVKQSSQSSSGIDVYPDDEFQASARYFYDTLIEYILLEKYKKPDLYGYDL